MRLFQNKYKKRIWDAIIKLEGEKFILEAEKGKYNISLSPKDVVKIIVEISDIDKNIVLLKSLL
jgi:hypothetical protein